MLNDDDDEEAVDVDVELSSDVASTNGSVVSGVEDVDADADVVTRVDRVYVVNDVCTS